jgi:spore germination protein PF
MRIIIAPLLHDSVPDVISLVKMFFGRSVSDMPSVILSPIRITSVSGTVTFGDVIQISPKSTSKSYSGSGGGNTGDFLLTNSLISNTNTSDPDVLDSLTALNN